MYTAVIMYCGKNHIIKWIFSLYLSLSFLLLGLYSFCSVIRLFQQRHTKIWHTVCTRSKYGQNVRLFHSVSRQCSLYIMAERSLYRYLCFAPCCCDVCTVRSPFHVIWFCLWWHSLSLTLMWAKKKSSRMLHEHEWTSMSTAIIIFLNSFSLVSSAFILLQQNYGIELQQQITMATMMMRKKSLLKHYIVYAAGIL